MRMRHGIFLPPFHALNENPHNVLQRDLELIEWLDRLGYDEAWIGEHHSAGFETIASPELFIAAAAERTKHIRLGTGVVSLPYHNPLMVANRIIQLDHMTRGRVMFGVGPGLLPSDAMMLGIDPNDPARPHGRGARRDPAPVPRRGRHREDRLVHAERRAPAPAALHASRIPRSRSPAPSRRRAAGWPAGTTSACCASPRPRPPASTRSTTNWQIACEIAAEHGRTMDPSRLRLVGADAHRRDARAGARRTCASGMQAYVDYINNNMPPLRRARPGERPVDY